jgi:outer membrane protein TolC
MRITKNYIKKFQFKKMVFALLIACLGMNAFTQELHLNVVEKAESVLNVEEDAYSLNEVKEMVAGDNVDVQLAYENLYQAQKRISLARAQYFPYGLGTVAIFYYVGWWNPIVLIELGTSLPSKFFAVQKEKNIRNAQYYNTLALRENVKNQIAHLYYNLVTEEAMIKLVEVELSLYEKLIISIKDKIALGLATENELKKAEMRLLNLRDEYLKFKSYVVEERSIMNVLLSKTPNEGKELKFQADGKFLELENFNFDGSSLADAALSRAYEITAAQYMINAAVANRRSVKWSILSFSGLGFEYYGRVKVAGSEVNEAVLQKELVEANVYNQVHSKTTSFKSAVEFYESEKNILSATQGFMEAELTGFKAGEVDLERLVEAQLIYLRDFREALASHYLALTKLDDLKRVVLGSVDKTIHAENEFKVSQIRKRKKTTLYIDADLNFNDIQMVSYEFDGKRNEEVDSFSSRSGFAITLRNSFLASKKNGVAKVFFENGQVVRIKFNLNNK